MFKVNDTVIHKTHGMGIVKSIETRTFSPENTQTFYVIEIEDNGAPKKVFVPVSASEKLRMPATKSYVKMVLNYINSNPASVIDHQTWNRRYRELMDMMHTGDLMELAKVYCELKNVSDPNFGERKLMECVTGMLRKEFESVGVQW